jgi:hypothetical protein
LKDFNWIVSIVKSDLMDTYTITDSSCGSKSNLALIHFCTCKAAANRSNVCLSGKKYIKLEGFPKVCTRLEIERILDFGFWKDGYFNERIS